MNTTHTPLPAPKLRKSQWGPEKAKRQQLVLRQRDGLRSDEGRDALALDVRGGGEAAPGPHVRC